MTGETVRGTGDGTAVVVGAGVGGLATAIGLRRAGWTVTVLERRAAPERYVTAFGIHPTAQIALDRLGLGDALRARAVPYRGARIRRPTARSWPPSRWSGSSAGRAGPNCSSPGPT